MNHALFRSTLLVAISLLVGCASASWYYSPAIYQIRSDLPPGTSLEKVDSYLTQHQVEHSYFRKDNQVMALVRNVRRDGLVQADVSLIFSFDNDRTLTNVLAKPAYTGP
jgi:hypothetical protein